jgi:hypothetical protein
MFLYELGQSYTWPTDRPVGSVRDGSGGWRGRCCIARCIEVRFRRFRLRADPAYFVIRPLESQPGSPPSWNCRSRDPDQGAIGAISPLIPECNP